MRLKEDDSDSSDGCVYLPPRRFMTNEEYLVYLRQVNESQGSDVQSFEGRLPDTIKPYTLNKSNCLPLIDFSKQALQVYNESNNTSFEFYNLVKANFQGVVGTMFYITFEVQSGNIPKTFCAKVWKKLKGSEVKSCEKHVVRVCQV
ncbi:hypothetical protein PIB30_095019 [Stylosanthes scabra]|uniref:Cystatin domain-containing protein n=1 Tax=Stylosanthes scabra TaxID=79078 RepID=A0ABU6YXF8_9FABA|nr:hypothetical protein [Stylosanthes scabra]